MIVVAAASAGGESPTTPAPAVAHGSGTIRRASAAPSTKANASSAIISPSTARAPPTAYAGAISSAKPTPCGSISRPSIIWPSDSRSRGYQLAYERSLYSSARSTSRSDTIDSAASRWCGSLPA